jgi:hypothetical protein
MLRSLVGIGLLLVSASMVAAQSTEAVLKLVPDSALAVTVVNHLETTSSLIEKLGIELKLGAPNPLSLIKAFGGITDGLDDKGTVVLALLPDPDGLPTPVPVVFVPVTDYDKFIAPLVIEMEAKPIRSIAITGKPLLACKKGSCAAVTLPQYESALENVLASETGIAAAVAPLADWTAANELSFIGVPAGIQTLLDTMQMGIAQAKPALERAGPETKAALAQIKIMEGLIDAARTELTLIGLGLDLIDEGHVAGSMRVQFAPSGEWARRSQGATEVSAPALTDLPAGPFGLAFASSSVEGWNEARLNFSFEMMRSSLEAPPFKFTKEQLDQLRVASAAMLKQVKQMQLAMTTGVPGESLLSGMLGIIKVENADQYISLAKDSLKIYEKIGGQGGANPLPSYQIEEIQVGGKTALMTTVDMLLMIPGMDQQPDEVKANLEPVMRALFGPTGKMTTYTVPLDNHRVLTAYNSKALDDYLRSPPAASSSLASDKNLQTTAALLPKGAQTVGYVDMQGVVTLVNATLNNIPAARGFQAPDFPAAPPIGIGSQLTAKGYELRLVAPKSLLSSIGDFVKTFRDMQQ